MPQHKGKRETIALSYSEPTVQIPPGPHMIRALSRKADSYLKNEYKHGYGFWHHFITFCVWFSDHVPAPSLALKMIAHLANPFNSNKPNSKVEDGVPVSDKDTINQITNEDD